MRSADFEKPKNVEKSGFQKNFEKKFRSESFSIRTSEGRAPASELVLQRGSLPSEIALQRRNIESKMVYRGVSADFEKPKNIFG